MSEQPKTRSEIREAQRRSSTSPVLIGGLVVLLIGAGAWLGKSLFFDDQTSPTSASVSTTAPTATPTQEPNSEPTRSEATATEDPLAASLVSCREAWTLQAAARAAAAKSLREWDDHIAIMNDLEAGKISLATAKAKWPATTANAPANIKAFRTADAALATSKASCVAPDATVTGAEADALRQCAASEQVVDGILAQARIAIKPWETHLNEQSHFKAGEVTPAVAEAKWRVKWKEGQKTLPGYNAAAKAGASASCELPG